MVTMVTTAPDTLPVTHGKLMLLQDTIRYYGHYGYYQILYRLLMINMLLPDTISFYGYYSYYRILYRLLMVNMLLPDIISNYAMVTMVTTGYYTSYSW